MKSPKLNAEEQVEQLNALVLSYLGMAPKQATILSGPVPPFDIKKSNIHDTKKEFLQELKAIEALINHANGILNILLTDEPDSDGEHRIMTDRLRYIIDFNNIRDRKRHPDGTAIGLVQHNITQTGFSHNLLRMLVDFVSATQKRHAELKDQEKEFWALSHRAPNYHARTIALRFARLTGRVSGFCDVCGGKLGQFCTATKVADFMPASPAPSNAELDA